MLAPRHGHRQCRGDELADDLPNLFQGDLVRLRAHEAEDWEVFWGHDSDTEMARAGWWLTPPQSAAATKKWIEEQALNRDSHDRSFVIETGEGEIAGSLSASRTDLRNGTFWYGIGIFAEHRRHGYASDAVRVLLRYYFGELRYQKGHAEVYEFNAPSLVMHERLGFVEEGRRRRAYRTGGRYFDEVLFGITAEEFAAANPSFAPHYE
jgi:RimJ/RimL family protein N-acetyltransferase